VDTERANEFWNKEVEQNLQRQEAEQAAGR
jgi:hypothetical protein